jgi:hypothetical protein
MTWPKTRTWSIANAGIKWDTNKRYIHIRNFINEWQSSKGTQAGVTRNLGCINLSDYVASK